MSGTRSRDHMCYVTEGVLWALRAREPCSALPPFSPGSGPEGFASPTTRQVTGLRNSLLKSPGPPGAAWALPSVPSSVTWTML